MGGFILGVLFAASINAVLTWFATGWAWDAGFQAGKLNEALDRLEAKLKGGA